MSWHAFVKIRLPFENKIALTTIKYRSGLQSSNCMKLLLTYNQVHEPMSKLIYFASTIGHLDRSEIVFITEVDKFNEV